MLQARRRRAAASSRRGVSGDGFRAEGPGFFLWQPTATERDAWLDELRPLCAGRTRRTRGSVRGGPEAPDRA